MNEYRVYDTINERYVTTEYDWAILPNGSLVEIEFGDLIARPGCIIEPGTCKKDKNGNIIFVGDIVNCHRTGDEDYTVKVVIDDPVDLPRPMLGSNVVCLEVVGTIHNQVDNCGSRV